MLKKSYTSIVAAGLTVLPLFALAQAAGPQDVNSLLVLLGSVVNWFRTAVFLIAVIMLLVAAFQFLTAAGNEEKVSTARKSLVWGLVGLAVALFASVAETFVSNLLGGR